MSVTTADSLDTPALVGAAPKPGRRSFLQRRRDKREAVFPNIPDKTLYEPIVEMKGLFGHYFVISDPAGVRRVLVENVANYPKTEMERRFFTALFGAGLLGTEGEVWRRHRRIMAPAFDPRSVTAYGPAISRACEQAVAKWSNLPDGAEVDVATDMSALTLQIISSTMFSTDSDEVIGMVAAVMKNGFEVGDFNILDLLPLIGPARMRRRERSMAQMFRPLDKAINRLIDERERDPKGAAADLLGRLVGAMDEDGSAGMTSREIRDQIITIFMAGHETTSQAMCWTWYLLSKHPAVEARLHAELDQVLGGRAPVQEDLPNLPYTRRVIEESMRLDPPAPGISSRGCLADDEVCGHKIPKGAQIAISPWLLHRHRKLWDDPERFDPDRFLPEAAKGRPRFAYLPFGAGPRVCIGQMLAMSEAILILAALAQRYALRVAPDQQIALQANITLRPKYGLRMLLERRAT